MGEIRKHIHQQRDDVAEILKLLRTERMTVQEISAELTISSETVRRWIDVFTTHGIVERIDGDDCRSKVYGGTVPFAYRLSKQWGGQG